MNINTVEYRVDTEAEERVNERETCYVLWCLDPIRRCGTIPSQIHHSQQIHTIYSISFESGEISHLNNKNAEYLSAHKMTEGFRHYLG